MSSKLHLSVCLDGKGYPEKIKAKDTFLRDADVKVCQSAIKDDKDAFFINALLSYSGTVSAIRDNNYSWAFIQSYYCVFFLAKTMLADKDYFIYYVEGKPYRIRISYGESFAKEKGNSHEVILTLFQKVFVQDSDVCSSIENENNIMWFNHKREEINYRLNPMPDPTPPFPLYEYQGDLRNKIATYATDSLYSFDANHCYVAYPTFLIRKVVEQYINNGRTNGFLTDELMAHLIKVIADSKGPLPLVNQLAKLQQ